MYINENEPGNKLIQFFQKTNDGKQILRDMMGRYISDDITQAAKQGFSSPDASWFKGESIDFVRRKLLHGNARIYNFLDREPVKLLVEEHWRKEKKRRLLIWSLLNVEAWIKEFLLEMTYDDAKP